MAKRLTRKDKEAIVILILGWSEADSGKLTWDAIAEAIAPIIEWQPTRQALNAHEQIKSPYQSVKKGHSQKDQGEKRPSCLKVAGERIARLERENQMLKDINAKYKQMFVTWQYNAYKRGLTEQDLNERLPLIDRERTDGEMR